MNSWTRRNFTKTVILAGATSALGAVRAAGANDRVRVGFIGVGNRGDQVLDAFLTHPDAEVVALCDLSQDYMGFAAKKIGASPRQFRDYRRLLELKDLDAVVIAVPDHWHALQTDLPLFPSKPSAVVCLRKPLYARPFRGLVSRRLLGFLRDNIGGLSFGSTSKISDCACG